VAADSPVLQQRWVKIVPHVIDTLFLLGSAAELAFFASIVGTALIPDSAIWLALE
jgi:uncharacterized membrane protein SirB2